MRVSENQAFRGQISGYLVDQRHGVHADTFGSKNLAARPHSVLHWRSTVQYLASSMARSGWIQAISDRSLGPQAFGKHQFGRIGSGDPCSAYKTCNPRSI